MFNYPAKAKAKAKILQTLAKSTNLLVRQQSPIFSKGEEVHSRSALSQKNPPHSAKGEDS